MEFNTRKVSTELEQLDLEIFLSKKEIWDLTDHKSQVTQQKMQVTLYYIPVH